MANNNDNIKVLVCDDHSIFRAGLIGVLRTEPGIEVIGEARDGFDGIEKTMELKPDVVIMDVLMPECDGLQALNTILTRRPETKVLMLTISMTDDHLLQSLRLGAQGYLSKGADIDEVVGAVKAVAAGNAMFSPNIAIKLAEQFRYPERGSKPTPKMSKREAEVLKLLGQGLGNLEIANAISIKESTVRSYLRRLARKLNLKTRAEVAIYAESHQDMTIETL
ncbi:MAG: response regulator transcription factor [Chloroflexi bacterium]|nr:response regulator transcription factor [Chloroflexota bacterium]